ncbi:MAG: hypothetical protein IJZ22_01695 [Bacteroidaceae bacterium]|nr:hypothetical protein [Bacteroidaceae bacterium]MBQ8542297.1 hypothetical protein [Bacteroidaceae bacterium]
MKTHAIYILIALATLFGTSTAQGASNCVHKVAQQQKYRECYNENAIERLAKILDTSSLALPHNIAVTGSKQHNHNNGKTGNGNWRYTASCECAGTHQQHNRQNAISIATGAKRGKDYYIYALRQILI